MSAAAAATRALLRRPSPAGPATLAAVLLAGCTAPAQPPLGFRCDDGDRFHVSYHPSGDTAEMAWHGMRFALRREPAESGELYACEVLSVWRLGDEALFDVQGRTQPCRVVR